MNYLNDMFTWAESAAPADVTEPVAGLQNAGYPFTGIPVYSDFNWIFRELCRMANPAFATAKDFLDSGWSRGVIVPSRPYCGNLEIYNGATVIGLVVKSIAADGEYLWLGCEMGLGANNFQIKKYDRETLFLIDSYIPHSVAGYQIYEGQIACSGGYVWFYGNRLADGKNYLVAMNRADGSIAYSEMIADTFTNIHIAANDPYVAFTGTKADAGLDYQMMYLWKLEGANLVLKGFHEHERSDTAIINCIAFGSELLVIGALADDAGKTLKAWKFVSMAGGGETAPAYSKALEDGVSRVSVWGRSVIAAVNISGFCTNRLLYVEGTGFTEAYLATFAAGAHHDIVRSRDKWWSLGLAGDSIYELNIASAAPINIGQIAGLHVFNNMINFDGEDLFIVSQLAHPDDFAIARICLHREPLLVKRQDPNDFRRDIKSLIAPYAG